MSDKPLARIACEAFWTAMGTGPEGQPPDAAWSWAHSQDAQGAWHATAQAVAAHVASPTAADSDSAAEIMRLRDAVMAAVDKFEKDLGFTAPELTQMRIDRLRSQVHTAFEDTSAHDGDDWFEVGDADAGTSPAEPKPAPELAAAMRETRELRERVAALADRLDADADGTSPSRKSEIQRDAARRLREALGGTS